MTPRSAASPLMPRTSPSAAQWPSAPILCWGTPPSAPGRLRGSWSGCGARNGGWLSWMRFTLFLVSCCSDSFTSLYNVTVFLEGWSSDNGNKTDTCALTYNPVFCSQDVSSCSDHCSGTLQAGAHCHTGQGRWQDRRPQLPNWTKVVRGQLDGIAEQWLHCQSPVCRGEVRVCVCGWIEHWNNQKLIIRCCEGASHHLTQQVKSCFHKLWTLSQDGLNQIFLIGDKLHSSKGEGLPCRACTRPEVTLRRLHTDYMLYYDFIVPGLAG